MLDWLSLTLLAALTAALLFGGMVYFAILFTPLTFRLLPRETAGAFLRQVFPAYYLSGALLAGLAELFALWPRPMEGAILLLDRPTAGGGSGRSWPWSDAAPLLADGYLSVGCEHCNGTGFFGRSSLIEVLVVNDAIRRLILQRAESMDLHRAAVEGGMRTMYDDGMQKALSGLTTVEEVLRVTRDV